MARSAPIQQADGSFEPSESGWESYREWAEQLRRQRDEADQLEEQRAWYRRNPLRDFNAIR